MFLGREMENPAGAEQSLVFGDQNMADMHLPALRCLFIDPGAFGEGFAELRYEVPRSGPQ